MPQAVSGQADFAYKNGIRNAYVAVSDFVVGQENQEAFKEHFAALG
jgi:hypothetical protein